MKINDIFTVSDMIRAIDNQNAHRNNEFCKSIVIENNEKIYQMNDGTNITFVEWALQCEVRGKRVFRNVFANEDNYVKFVYDRNNHNEVRTIMGKLYETVEKKFSASIAAELFTSKMAYRASLNIKEAELEYLQATAASLRSNPQDTDNDISYRPRGPRAVPTFGPAKNLANVTYSQAVKPNGSSTQTEDRIKQLEDNLLKLSTDHPAPGVSVKEKVASLVQGEMKSVYDLIKKNKRSAEKKILTVVQQVKESETRNKNRIKKGHMSLTKLMIDLHKKTLTELKPSSSAKKSRRGGK